MSNYFNLKNQTILNPPAGTDLGTGANKYANVYIGNQLTLGTTTVDSTSIGSIKISGIAYPGDDTAADVAGGQTITITGSGFVAGASVVVDGVTVGVVSVVSSTQITFVAPAKAAGSYSLYVINPDGATAISVVGIQFSGVPAWNTAAGSLSTVYEGATVDTQLAASGDAPVIYSLSTGSLPGGLTLYGNGRVLGTANSLVSSTTYNFTVKASDYQNQDTDRSFSYTVNPDVVTFNTPGATQTYSNATNDAFSLTLNATSAAGRAITYTANTLPTGLSISGANISGTLGTVGTTSSLITATAAGSGKTATRALTWSVASPVPTVELLLVAGGGYGGVPANGVRSGGGGAGGLLYYGSNSTPKTPNGSAYQMQSGTYTVTVGAGGSAGTNGNYSNLALSGTTIYSAIGGGHGAAGNTGDQGATGGSGGGSCYYTGGYGTPGQGNDGGQGRFDSYADARGGGGGAGGVGGNATAYGPQKSGSYAYGGNGGAGLTYDISGTSTTYAGGGGGYAAFWYGSGSYGSGGSGGGGAGGYGAGADNTGGGGGGGELSGGNGGSGIVIIRYASTFPAAAATTGSPTVTVAGGYRVYKFTSSGSITF
jgi:hypothetical protein